MCGIAGIISPNKKRIRLLDLKAMGEAMAHRGPDDEGFLRLDNVGFVHKRLSIIDLVTGHQPMSSEDASIWIVYNGEIYNYIELRSELVAQGHEFKTHSDTEVIIHLYEEYGKDALLKLNGMFAFTIYDKNKNKIFAARDHFGIKPYYYVFDKEEFIFASEIKAILRVRPSYKSENYQAIYDYLVFQFCLGEKTFFRGINKLLPGHYLVLENIAKKPHLSVHKYWDFDFSLDGRHKEKYFADRLLATLKDSVRLQLRSDVELGCHLSGGLDSSLITCLASKISGTKIKTFTGAFNAGAEYDETVYAKAVSRYIKSEHFQVNPTAGDFKKHISRIIYMMDEPVAGPGVFPQFLVSKLASQNVKVVLGGQGADEMFGGYARYLVAYLESGLKRAIFQTREEGNDIIRLESMVPNLHTLRRYVPLIRHCWSKGIFEDMDQRYFDLINRSYDTDKIYSRTLLGAGKDYNVFAQFRDIFNSANTRSYINKMIHFDLKTLLPALLHVEDRTSMSFSLESRVPFLDARIAQLAASIPPGIKMKGGISKYILKKAVEKIIPAQVISRNDKMGFPVPIVEWFKGELNGFVRDILLSRSARKRGIYNIKGIEEAIAEESKFDRQIWGALCLELWFNNFIDR